MPKAKVRLITKTCEKCGIKFEVTVNRFGRRYCSDACAKTARRIGTKSR